MGKYESDVWYHKATPQQRAAKAALDRLNVAAFHLRSVRERGATVSKGVATESTEIDWAVDQTVEALRHLIPHVPLNMLGELLKGRAGGATATRAGGDGRRE